MLDGRLQEKLGAGLHILDNEDRNYYFGPNSSICFKRRLFLSTKILFENNTAGKNIIINYDSQATIRAVTT